jgi:hypothetical protein
MAAPLWSIIRYEPTFDSDVDRPVSALWSAQPITLRRIDRVGAGVFRCGRHFRLLTRLCECACTRCGPDDHLEGVTNCHLGCLAEVAVNYDEKAIPPFSDVAVEFDAVRASGHQPTMPAHVKTQGLPQPPLLRIEWNEDNGYALVTFDQLSFESHLVHSVSNLTVAKN